MIKVKCVYGCKEEAVGQSGDGSWMCARHYEAYLEKLQNNEKCSHCNGKGYTVHNPMGEQCDSQYIAELRIRLARQRPLGSTDDPEWKAVKKIGRPKGNPMTG